MARYDSSHTGQWHDSNVLRSELLDLMYPIGAVYISTAATDPASVFGGTWQRIQDTFLLCAGSTYAPGTTGGAATMAHTHTLSHTHSQVAVTTGGSSAANSGGTAISVAQMPSHNHGSAGGHTHTVQRNGFGNLNLSGSSTKAGGTITNWGGETTNGWDGSIVTNSTGAHTHSSNGSGSAHSHTIAHTHSIGATTTGGASATTTSAASNTNNMPPYLAVYVWKRTA